MFAGTRNSNKQVATRGLAPSGALGRSTSCNGSDDTGVRASAGEGRACGRTSITESAGTVKLCRPAFDILSINLFGGEKI